ncbi:hypothetical protein GCM10009737_22150 [Nocardioides lentus]|uniref:Uncharacterized protein n=1 Tax=Nocardioides lentus TaxID=338077 RepID=A0ABP5AU33_9ACTN
MPRARGVLLTVLVLALSACGALPGGGPGGPDDTAPEVVADGSPTQPASLVYGDTAGVEAYARPGGLVVAGRDNFDDPAFAEVSRAGGSVLLYLDPVIDNAYGRYHRLLLGASACGPAVPDWPGSPVANDYGSLADFRVGSVLQDKLPCVLETMVAENPRMAGWFADDVGSRSWFPEIDWDSWSPEAQQAYRDGAIALTRTFRRVADAHGLVVVVNGTWTAGDLAGAGGGYPDPEQHGNALADGGFVENHDTGVAFFTDYACSPQWAAESPVTEGRAINFAVTRTDEGLQAYVDSGCFAYAQRHETYDLVRPWAGNRDIGLPTEVAD